MVRRIPVNERNQPLGESRRNCTIPDAVVVQIRDMREKLHLEVPEIVRRIGLSYGTVEKIVYYRRRASVPRDWRIVEDE